MFPFVEIFVRVTLHDYASSNSCELRKHTSIRGSRHRDGFSSHHQVLSLCKVVESGRTLRWNRSEISVAFGACEIIIEIHETDAGSARIRGAIIPRVDPQSRCPEGTSRS